MPAKRLINQSGRQDRAFHDPLPILDIDLSLALDGARPAGASALVADQVLPLTIEGERTLLRLPRLEGFEVVVLS